ncbi:MAG: hypothetical protein MAGBODY4_00216 [Candidatus Marinimicrobia bacterium]|nr:hypothetical protein [Candidatus Neomarinimicrobiota bacterium]
MTRKRLVSGVVILIKLCISAALLYWITRQIEFRQLGQFVRENTGTVILVLGFALLLWAVEFLRFLILCRQGGLTQPIQQILRVFFVGFSLRFVLPGSQGEIGKMLFIRGEPSRRVAVYVIEKVSFVFAVLFSVGLLGWIVFPDYVWLEILLLALLIAGLFLWKPLAQWNFVKKYLSEKLRRRRVFLLQLGFSFVHIAIVVLQYWVFLRIFDIGLLEMGSIVSLVLAAILIPISFAGLGVRESVAFTLLQQYGVTADVGIGVPLLVFAVNVVLPALIGVVIFLSQRMKTEGRSEFPEDEQEYTSLEETLLKL